MGADCLRMKGDELGPVRWGGVLYKSVGLRGRAEGGQRGAAAAAEAAPLGGSMCRPPVPPPAAVLVKELSWLRTKFGGWRALCVWLALLLWSAPSLGAGSVLARLPPHKAAAGCLRPG